MRLTERQGGFTYLLLLVALSALALSLLKSQDSVQMRYWEQQEAELLFRGEQYRAAIAAYRAVGNGCFPVRVEQLTLDKRGPTPRYHLRQAWVDPLTNDKTWGAIYDPQGRWIGVRSLGKGKPRRKVGFSHDIETFSKAKSYYDWTFKVEGDPQAPMPAACGR
ncbi:type II secretion system protein [Cedecea sp.]|jgi:type II secretory pathway pseudopilin PulG|uniref:type II secretion system protein n=1 Tax=Cedecea sp. TaxID=1970739 RepID=UPI0012AD865D|nr:type II secretion system protein [Enterobacteriaceae bacterium RIT693]